MLAADLLALVAFIAAAGVLTVTPGVDTAMVLRSSASNGPRGGVAAGLGICGGLLVWGAGAALGLTALLEASAVMFNVVRWVGAAYLLVVGLRLIIRPRTLLVVVDDDQRLAKDRSGIRDALRRGFLTNVLNPKVGIFYVTFLPQFIPSGVNVAVFSMGLAVVHVLLTAVWFTLLIALTVSLGRYLRRPGVVRTLDRLTGCVFIAFGAKLAVAHRA